jgi:hypothetical protein
LRSSPDVVRTLCPSCGSALTYPHEESPEAIDVTTSTLDIPVSFGPAREVWLEHRLSWETVNDGLAQYPKSSSME